MQSNLRSSDPTRVSVIVPVHNGEATLEACIRSILAQVEVELEVLAIEDGSSDRSFPILTSLAREDRRLVVVRHQKNEGLPSTWNNGLRLARFELVLLNHQDCIPQGTDWLTRAVRALNDLRADLVSGRPQLAEGLPLEGAFAAARGHRYNLLSERPIPWTEFKCDLARKSVLLAAGGFEESYRISGEDQEMSLRLCRQGARLFQVPNLSYNVRVETRLGWMPHLRKEYLYARAQAVLIIRTRMGVIRSGSDSLGSERLLNRLLATLWPLAGSLGLILFYFFGPLVFAPMVSLFLVRLIILFIRITDSSYGLPMRRTYLVWMAAALGDIVYTIGLGIGLLREVASTIARMLTRTLHARTIARHL